MGSFKFPSCSLSFVLPFLFFVLPSKRPVLGSQVDDGILSFSLLGGYDLPAKLLVPKERLNDRGRLARLYFV